MVDMQEKANAIAQASVAAEVAEVSVPVDVPPPDAAAEAVDQDSLRYVLDLALPAVGEQMLNMMVGLVDTFLVGHLGAAPLAAVGLSNNIVMLATTFFSAVATGTTALVARHTGAREHSLANRIMHQSLLISVALGVASLFTCYGGARAAMLIMGAQDDVIGLGCTYLQIVSLSLVASSFMFVGNAALRGSGDTRTPMKVMGAVNGVNIVVAYTLINGLGPFPALGVAGSALGAALGRTFGAIIVLLILLKGKGNLHLSMHDLAPDMQQLKRIVNVGLPAGVEMVIMRVGMTIFAATVASLGTIAYAAHQVVMTSESLSFQPGFGFSTAASTLTGQGLGAKNPRRAERGALTALRLAMLTMSLMGVLFFLFPRQFMIVFTNDPQVIGQGIAPLRLIALSQPFLALTMVLSGALRGAGDTRGPLVVTTIGIWCVRLPVALILVRGTSLGLIAAWITMIVDQLVRSIFFILRFRSGRWKNTRV